MTIRNPDGSLACICHEHNSACHCATVPAPNPLPGRRGWVVVALYALVLVAFGLAGHATVIRLAVVQ